MKKISLSPFELFSLSWISVAIVGLTLALLNIFYKEFIFAWIIIFIILTVNLIKKEKITLKRHTPGEILVFSVIVSIGILLSYFVTPTIFGGRDEGSLATNAILLSQNHSLNHSDEMVKQFFGIYGPGKALNFPGFFYTNEGELRSQFLPAYPSWLAVFYSFFGYNGLKFANLLPFVTFIFSFYLILKKFSNRLNFPLFGTLTLISIFPITLFYKFTLTETFFAALIWFSIHFILRHLEEKSFWTFFLIFLPLFITPFLRIESIGFGFMLLFTLILLDFEKMRLPKYRLLFIFCGIIAVASFMINSHFFTETVKNFAEISPIENIKTDWESKAMSFIPKDWKGFYMLKILFNYNLLPIVVLGLSFIYVLFRKKKWEMLLPFIFLSPAFIYLIDANISLDHPWMLRRFVFAIIPISLLYGILLIEKTAFTKRLPLYILGILIVLNLTYSIPFVTYSQNKGLLEKTTKLMSEFEKDDLILISQKASGNGWSLLSEPTKTILGKNAVYFFNQNDFSKLDTTKFKDVYLVTSQGEVELYDTLLKTKIKDYEISNNIVYPSKDPLSKPANLPIYEKGSIYKLEKIQNL